MLFVAIPAIIAVLGILAVLAIYGVRKYIATAKTAEARNSVSMIGRDAALAFEERQKLCASASSPVPASVQHGMKYQSSTSEWTVDEGRDAGFACIKFMMTMPQYYQYDYQSTGSEMTGIARGDLTADGVESRFELQGKVSDGRLLLSPSLLETDPFE